MKKLLNILYVQSQGTYLRREGETVVAEREHEVVARIPIHTLSTKDVNLNINGSGGFSLGGGGVTLQTVENYMMDNLRPVLLQLLSQETMEEGDAVYEF